MAGVALWCTVGLDASAGGDDASVSRSRGHAGGAVVLWPRVVPDTHEPSVIALAQDLQNRLAAMAARTLSDKRLNVRPQPERVCPLKGCRAVSISVMLGHQDGGCVAVAMISEPDVEAATLLVPWAGEVELRTRSIPFREPPENRLTVREFVPCEELVNHLDDAAVEAAIAGFSEG